MTEESKVSPFTTAMFKAHERLTKSYGLAHDKLLPAPIMHKKIDPRTYQREQLMRKQIDEMQRGERAWTDLAHLQYDSPAPSEPLSQRPRTRDTEGREVEQKLKLDPGNLQSDKNKLAGKPKWPNEFESGRGPDAYTPSAAGDAMPDYLS